jgi:basic amino acid/polyamine antiporter, APA family
VLPWRKPEIYNASPIARYTVLGIPLVTVSAVLFAAFLIFCLFKWLTDATYGINNPQSLIYMLVLYGVALAMYVVFRLVRRAQ